MASASDLNTQNGTSSLRLSVIVPVRVTASRRDLISRIRSLAKNAEDRADVEFLTVDDGSHPEFTAEVNSLESRNNRVITTGSHYYQDFSLARARNRGARTARGQFLLFLDADLLPYPGFYDDLLREIDLLEMETFVHKFVMIPVIYLSEAGLSLLASMDPRDWRGYFINAMLRQDSDLVEKTSSGTSVIALDRFYYLSRGGQDEDFAGWGYEDYEFTNRLIRRDRRFPLPPNWLSMAGNFFTISQFDGWKSVYRLYGDWSAAKGIYLFHAPHPIERSYHSRKKQNELLLQSKMKEDSQLPCEPQALSDVNRGRTLLLSKNPFCYSRELIPYLGDVRFCREADVRDLSELVELFHEGKFDRVVMGNPYALPLRQSFYEWCRQTSVECVVCERGALPDAVYHDAGGFLNDSNSYDVSMWDRPLTAQEREATLKYIAQLREGEAALESQPARTNVSDLRQRLGVPRDKKVLLVPFQQPNDTVIREFSKSCGGFLGFRELVKHLSLNLGEDWVIVVKKHPVEDALDPIEGVVDGGDANIYDLIELSDSVLVINSGVGLLSLAFSKKVFVAGEAWYDFQGLTSKIQSQVRAAQQIRNGYEFDFEKMLRFLHYLRFEFYSFGRMDTRRVRYPDGSPITATTSIHYYELRAWDNGRRRIIERRDEPIGNRSPLFDRYRSKSAVVQTQGNGVAIEDQRRRAQQLFHSKHYLEAAALFEAIYAAEPRRASALRAAAECYYRGGKRAKAIEKLTDAALVAPDNKNIKRRMRELSAPSWRRLPLLTKPYPVPRS